MYGLFSEAQIHNSGSTDGNFRKFYCCLWSPPSWIVNSDVLGLLRLSKLEIESVPDLISENAIISTSDFFRNALLVLLTYSKPDLEKWNVCL